MKSAVSDVIKFTVQQDSSPDQSSLTDNIPLAGRGIRRLVALFTPVANLVYEFDRRNELTALGLSDDEADPADPAAVAAQKE